MSDSGHHFNDGYEFALTNLLSKDVLLNLKELNPVAAEVLSLSTQEATREEVARAIEEADDVEPQVSDQLYVYFADFLRERFVITRRTDGRTRA